MNVRGRLTLVLLSLGLLGSAVFGLRGCGTPGNPGSFADSEESERPPPAPSPLLARLPVTLADFEARLSFPDAAPMDGGGLAEVRERFVERHPAPEGLDGPLDVEFTLQPDLMERVFRILRQARVGLGHVLVLDPASGRLLAYASTDLDRFPPNRIYPAASLIKIVTAAAALDRDPGVAHRDCRYVGSPYRLTPSRVNPPRRGKTTTLRRALAVSNNQCFAQLAVHTVGGLEMLEAIRRFGLLEVPARGHAPGSVDPGDNAYDLGKLGCGLAGTWITPLHAVSLGGILVDGRRVSPRWVERVTDASGVELALPSRRPPRRVLTAELAGELRGMLVDTTVRGTARRAFRNRRGRPLLAPVQVAGKTGSLSGRSPKGRYEWFVGVAPAEEPTVAVAVVLVQGRLWWRSASQVAAEVFKTLFCPKGVCSPDATARWIEEEGPLDRVI